MDKFIGAALFSIGALIVFLSGGCTLFVLGAMFMGGQNAGDAFTDAVVPLLIGGFFLAIGGALIYAGYRIFAPLKPPLPPPDQRSSGESPGPDNSIT
jgi:hypothetical protein